MKTVHMLGNGNIEIIDLPEPEPYDNFVVVKIMCSSICGTEFTSYFGNDPLPSNSGHEAAGVIWKTDNARYVKKGDRVSIYPIIYYFCHRCPPCLAGDWLHCQNPIWPKPNQKYPGNHSQYILVREDICLPIPDDISFEAGALIDDCFGTPYQAIKHLQVNAFDTVLITGVGPIGAAAVMLSKFLNATVIAVDINDMRLDHVSQYGVEHTINPTNNEVLKTIRKITNNKGIDVALECSGMEQAQIHCLEAVKPRGRIAFLGIKSESTKVRVLQHFILKDLTAIGSWAMKPSMHSEIIELFRRGVPAEKLITHRYKIEDASSAFEAFFSGEAVKVTINPWD
jgi:propanol-preferring alcohol dehydrogenase